ncbi:MAG TPA: hypothetical protein VHY08_04350, partial [Bacillota bacterium]|nr:hypothetical protein [Bacillota bacterium]
MRGNVDIVPFQSGYISNPTQYTVDHPMSNLDFISSWGGSSGRLIYNTYDVNSNCDLKWINPEDLSDTFITNDHLSIINFSWIPQDGKILFSKRRGLMSWENCDFYVMNFDGTGVNRITNEDTLKLGPVYSPNKSKIAYYSGNISGGARIYIMNSDGSNPTLLPLPSSIWYSQYLPDWSPDGTKLVYAAMGSENSLVKNAIFVSTLDGTNQYSIQNVDIVPFQSGYISNPTQYTVDHPM